MVCCKLVRSLACWSVVVVYLSEFERILGILRRTLSNLILHFSRAQRRRVEDRGLI